MSKLVTYMIVDDNKIDNFFHERVIRKTGLAEKIIIKESATEALDYLKHESIRPDIIFLDIHMPEMSGWEFLDAYIKHNIKSPATKIVIMLGSSEYPLNCDKYKKELDVSCHYKPLSAETIKIVSENI